MESREDLFGKVTSFLVPLGAIRIAIFGSYARDQATRESDLDILVRFVTPKSLLELIRIERELSELLGIKVDLLTEKAISPYLIDRIREESTVIHG